MNDARAPATTPGPAHPPAGSAGFQLTHSGSVRPFGLKGFNMRRSLKRALLAPAVLLIAASVLAACSSSSSSSSPASASGGLKKGLKVFVIPKNLGNPYFTTADSATTGGALAALSTLGATGTETSGTQATPASQIPAIQAAISKGANALIVSATDPSALCPTLNGAMAKGITVVTYDSDAPT